MKNDDENDRTFQNRKMVQASSLGPNKHKRGRLRYLRSFLFYLDWFWHSYSKWETLTFYCDLSD